MEDEALEALKAADRLNDILGPTFRAYMREMRRLSCIAGRPLFTVAPQPFAYPNEWNGESWT